MSWGKKALIVAVGSRGDVAPPAGVGARLRQAGYAVTMAADKAFADLIADAGLEFQPLAADLRAGSQTQSNAARDGLFSRSGAKLLKAAKHYIRELNTDVAAITEASTADIVLLNPLGMAAYHVAEARGIPTVALHLQPQHPTAEFPPMVFGRSLGALGNRIAGRLVRMAERMYFTSINDIRVQYGLAPTTLAATYRRQADEQWPVLHGISPQVLPRPRDWRPGLDIVGYWWPPMPANFTPPDELSAFLDAGPPPVFVGFGSTNPGDADQLSRTVTTALRQAGHRGIIQAGWAELSTKDDDMLTIGDVPHEWLLPRTTAAIHAAGAGTTAAGLRAGIPAVPVPMTNDGPFWSYRLRELGVSPGPIPLKKLTPDRLTAALREATTNPAYRAQATALAAKINAEDGAASVLGTVNDLA